MEKIFKTYPIENSIAAVIMCKNEHKRIHVTLESVKDYVNCIIIYDTGSTDDTLDIIKKFCEKHKLNYHIITGTFVDFSISRNVLLDYADTINVEFLLLLDVNDELQNGKTLLRYIRSVKKEDTGFLLCQMWKSCTIDKYFNVRLVRARNNWRYRGVVHEYITNGMDTVTRCEENIVIYQDRTSDDNKSFKRFSRDKELLLAEFKKNPQCGRTVFYLAQTCSCLEQYKDAYYYYKLRTELGEFFEERFISMNRLGEIGQRLGHDWADCLKWFFAAFECISRVEPLVRISEYYISKENWFLAWMFINSACELEYPHHLILFVDKAMYDYYRWHLLGRVAYYVNKFDEGKVGCEKALKERPDSEIDKQNYNCYLKREEELKPKVVDRKTMIHMAKRTLNKKANHRPRKS